MNKMITLAQLRAFEAVAGTLHFGRAAERLGVAQSVVSQEIGRLERALGLLLFDRSTRVVRPTAAGVDLLRAARATVNAADRFGNAARGIAGRPDVVTVAVSPSVMDGLARRVVDRATARADVEIRFLPVETGDVGDTVDEGSADIGVGRFLNLSGPRYRVRPIGEDALHAVVSVDRDRGGPIDLGELADLPLLLWPRDRNPKYFDRIVDVCAGAGIEPMIVVSSPRVVGRGRSPVSMGRAFTIVPAPSASAVEPGAVARPITPAATVPLAMAWRADDERASLRAVLRVIRDAAAEPAPASALSTT